MVNTDPEELLRSIERTREELANTVDTIAGRLDPKRAAKRGVGAVRDGVTSVVEGAKVKLHLASDGTPTGAGQVAAAPGEDAAASIAAAASERAKAIAAAKAAVVARAKRSPKQTGGLAALVALAAIVAVRRTRR
jgi:hypothetical protein